MKKESNYPGTFLLVMDIQKTLMEFIKESSVLLNNIKNAIVFARQAGIPIVYVKVSYRNDYPEINLRNRMFSAVQSRRLFLESDKGTAIHETVAPMIEDIVVVKKRISAFAGSDLDIVLRSLNAKHLIITGFATSGVVLNTVLEAADKDYEVTVLSDGCSDPDKDTHQFLIEKILPMHADIMNTKAWISSLDKG